MIRVRVPVRQIGSNSYNKFLVRLGWPIRPQVSTTVASAALNIAWVLASVSLAPNIQGMLFTPSARADFNRFELLCLFVSNSQYCS
jgi:hypothetical protein